MLQLALRILVVAKARTVLAAGNPKSELTPGPCAEGLKQTLGEYPSTKVGGLGLPCCQRRLLRMQSTSRGSTAEARDTVVVSTPCPCPPPTLPPHPTLQDVHAAVVKYSLQADPAVERIRQRAAAHSVRAQQQGDQLPRPPPLPPPPIPHTAIPLPAAGPWQMSYAAAAAAVAPPQSTHGVSRLASNLGGWVMPGGSTTAPLSQRRGEWRLRCTGGMPHLPTPCKDPQNLTMC